jgi:hypothetical protein
MHLYRKTLHGNEPNAMIGYEFYRIRSFQEENCSNSEPDGLRDPAPDLIGQMAVNNAD